MPDKTVKLCPRCQKYYQPKKGIKLIEVETDEECIFGSLTVDPYTLIEMKVK